MTPSLQEWIIINTNNEPTNILENNEMELEPNNNKNEIGLGIQKNEPNK
jgi:hypothetical protein